MRVRGPAPVHLQSAADVTDVFAPSGDEFGGAPMPAITVIVPTLNEVRHIEALLRQVLLEPVAEVLVVDGGSDDGTQDLVAALAREDERLHLLHNPRRLQSAGINLAARHGDTSTAVLVRLDAHSIYPKGFVAQAASILAETGADSVVVRLRTCGHTCFEKAVAAVSNSAFGTGGAAHRVGGGSGWIDHGHHAAFLRRSFELNGGYDPTLRANEDAEYDVRLRRAGGRIWFASELAIDYIPRGTPLALARQYFRYGAGRAHTFRTHRETLRARQMAAPVILLTVVGGMVLGSFQPLALAAPAVYGLGVISAALRLTSQSRDWCVLGAVVALPIIHLSWGAGFSTGLLRPRRWRSRPRSDDAYVEVAKPVA